MPLQGPRATNRPMERKTGVQMALTTSDQITLVGRQKADQIILPSRGFGARLRTKTAASGEKVGVITSSSEPRIEQEDWLFL